MQDDSYAVDNDSDEDDMEDDEEVPEEDREEDTTLNGAATMPQVAQPATSPGSVQSVLDHTGLNMTQVVQASEGPNDTAMTDVQGEHEAVAEDFEGEQEGVQDPNVAQADGDDTTAVDATAGTAEPEIFTVLPHHKWRHVSKFMHLTQCPPQADLFLIAKQLNIEAKEWFYDVATLKIDATASFLHCSFFELALNKLAEAPFSPMENIKKAEITFVWDTTWIRAEPSGFAGAVFPVLLKSRVDFILEILLRAPELKEVKIHWHDSAEDDGAKQLRADTLEQFILNLRAVVETEDHYIAPDAKPRAKSRAGKQRLEFKAIIDNGCETF